MRGCDGPVTPLYNRRRGSFKPLSLVAGRPFEFDVNRALEIVQQNSLSPATCDTPSRDPVKKPHPSFTMANRRQDDERTIKPAKSFLMSSPDLSRPLHPQPSSSPPESASYDQIQVPKQRVVTGEYRDLRRVPLPDLRQHPVFQADPNSSSSDAPLKVTTSKKEEIKRLVREARQQFDEKERQMERAEAEQEETERRGKRKFNSLPRQGNAFVRGSNSGANPFNSEPAIFQGAMTPSLPETFARRPTPRASSGNTYSIRNNLSRLQINPDNEEADIYDILNEGSPMAAMTPTQAKVSTDSSKPAMTPVSEGFEQKKTGLRKVTGMFKPKPEKSLSDLTSPREPDMLHRPDLVSTLFVSGN